jgi:uncharacterized repeat protein (TIGR03803 family)
MGRIVKALGKLSWGKRAYAVFVLCAMTAIGLPAQTFTTLHAFEGRDDGAQPFAGLVQATNGDFYGTTSSGGANNDGTVFKITPSGTVTTLYNFCSQSACADGAHPYLGALAQATNGDLYGTTYGGGANGNYGTVFKITPSGTLTTLYSFCSQGGCTDGSYPWAGLVQATNGDLYGTTLNGGTNNGGAGTVFKITPHGTLTTLYSFCSQGVYPNCTDGVWPYAGLIQASDGDLYGTTEEGGSGNAEGDSGGGTIFKITPSGTLTTVYSFCSQKGCLDGAKPYGGLVQAINGDFYGTTSGGGSYNSYGTVFKITPSGALTKLHAFCYQEIECTDGYRPKAGLVQATNGDFYGTTYYGGANAFGTVFQITSDGTLTTLYTFCSQSGCTDGRSPPAGLFQATNGRLYGTTEYGGAGCFEGEGCGTVFSLSLGLGPFVQAQPRAGNVGAVVNILGDDLTGATSVSFNGTAATFTVASPALITTAVPAGASNGSVQVVTPSGTLSSNVPFQVLP